MADKKVFAQNVKHDGVLYKKGDEAKKDMPKCLKEYLKVPMVPASDIEDKDEKIEALEAENKKITDDAKEATKILQDRIKELEGLLETKDKEIAKLQK